jgi:hypothetical protein
MYQNCNRKDIKVFKEHHLVNDEWGWFVDIEKHNEEYRPSQYLLIPKRIESMSYLLNNESGIFEMDDINTNTNTNINTNTNTNINTNTNTNINTNTNTNININTNTNTNINTNTNTKTKININICHLVPHLLGLIYLTIIFYVISYSSK